MSKIIVKIAHGTDIRRFTTDRESLLGDAGWKSLAKRVIDLFSLAREWKAVRLTYVDDEGDVITCSSGDELAEAVMLACVSDPAILRLAVREDTVKPTTVNAETSASKPETTDAATSAAPPPGPAKPADDDVAAFISNLAKQLPDVVHQLPEGLKTFLPRYELDMAATLAANAAKEAANTAKEVTNNLRRAGESARAQRAAAWRAETNGAANAAATNEGVHPGVRCDKTGMCPIRGNRYHLVGHDYDLCEAEYAKLSPEEQAKFEKIPPCGVRPTVGPDHFGPPSGFHPGVECDRSGMCPIVGIRYNMRGRNYDLCEAEYAKLDPEEKRNYVAIQPPVCRPHHVPSMEPSAAFGSQMAAAARAAFGPWRRPRHAHLSPPGCGAPCASMPPQNGAGCAKLSSRFVRDVTIFDGTQCAPSTPFTKIWRLKNNGEVPWPPNSRILFVGGDQMTSDLSVPLSCASAVMPGEETDVAVSMTAPAEPGRYLGYWRLVGPMGRRRFGHRVWCHIQVLDPDAAADAAEDIASMQAEIENKKRSVDEGVAPEDKEEMDDKPDDKGAVAPVKPDDKQPDDKQPDDDKGAVAPAKEDEVQAEGAHTKNAAAADVSETASDDGVLVDTAEAVDATSHELSSPSTPSSGKAKAVGEPDTSTVEGVKLALGDMGFEDATMVQAALAKHGPNLDACASALAAATEWESLLEDLSEMGFSDRELNKAVMLKHNGNIKRTVKELVENA